MHSQTYDRPVMIEGRVVARVLSQPTVLLDTPVREELLRVAVEDLTLFSRLQPGATFGSGAFSSRLRRSPLRADAGSQREADVDPDRPRWSPPQQTAV